MHLIGGSNSYWMNIDWMDGEEDIGNVMPVDPLDIMLPDTYIGGDPGKEKKEIEARIAKIAEPYRPMYKVFFKSKNAPFLAADSVVHENDPVITVVSTGVDKLPCSLSV
jgi:hypothetical protein